MRDRRVDGLENTLADARIDVAEHADRLVILEHEVHELRLLVEELRNPTPPEE